MRIEAKLDLSLQRAVEDRQAHDNDMSEVRADIEKLQDRVGSLENWRYAIGAALLMSSASAIGAAINIVPK
ncbi:membrane protein [Streptomyces phage Zuko]|uniref:Membrane protein n=1 Tax=Streptomyces phage Zuko TaxID=2601695 RepID=A0A5J6D700_9CAUD|nr:membrane protein [Streptomyces phage Zuko]QEQ93610.1 membrane protein [Streptomyces phage Zuko]